MSRNTVYSALIVSIVALLIAIWAIWTASDLRERVDAMERRVVAVEGAPTFDPAVLEDLRDALAQLEARLAEVEQAAAAPAPTTAPMPAAPQQPEVQQPTVQDPAVQPAPVQPQ
jgi:hypothetical protein